MAVMDLKEVWPDWQEPPVPLWEVCNLSVDYWAAYY